MINIAQQISNSVSHNITDQIWDAIDISVEQELSDRLWRTSFDFATLNPANPRMRHAVLQEMREYEFES
jgi:flagellar motor switch protein FliG